AILGRRVCHLNGIQPHSRRPLWWWLIGRPYTSPNVGCRRLIHGLSGICLLGGSRPAESDPGLPWPRPGRPTVDLLRKPSAAQPPAAASATAAGASARP